MNFDYFHQKPKEDLSKSQNFYLEIQENLRRLKISRAYYYNQEIPQKEDTQAGIEEVEKDTPRIDSLKFLKLNWEEASKQNFNINDRINAYYNSIVQSEKLNVKTEKSKELIDLIYSTNPSLKYITNGKPLIKVLATLISTYGLLKTIKDVLGMIASFQTSASTKGTDKPVEIVYSIDFELLSPCYIKQAPDSCALNVGHYKSGTRVKVDQYDSREIWSHILIQDNGEIINGYIPSSNLKFTVKPFISTH